MRTINALVTLALTVTPMFVWGHSQKRGQADQLATPAQGWYAQKASDISKENRYTTRQTLENDKATIKAAFPKLRAFYSDKEFGRSDPELLDIMGQAWSDIRRENPNTPLTSDDFVKFAEGFGGLKIRSEPPKAAIRVDEKAWTDPTNTEGGALVGERTIKLSLENYEEETGPALVKQGKWTTFSRTLRKKK